MHPWMPGTGWSGIRPNTAANFSRQSFDSFAPGEPDGFACSMVNPLAGEIDAVELAGNPTPAKTSSFADAVVAVGPLLTAVPLP